MERLIRVGLLGCALALVLAASASAAGYVPGRVIVKYNAGVSAAQRASAENSAGVGSLLETLRGGARVVKVSGSVPAAAAALNRSSKVAYAEPDYVLTASAIPNDPSFSQLYGLNNTGQTGGKPDADIDAPEGWDAAGLSAFPSSGGVKVGIVDTGILSTHEDLLGKTAACAKSQGPIPLIGGSIQVGSCPDDNGHGTHVAGTITA